MTYGRNSQYFDAIDWRNFWGGGENDSFKKFIICFRSHLTKFATYFRDRWTKISDFSAIFKPKLAIFPRDPRTKISDYFPAITP